MITTFGEIMLRLSPADAGERIVQAQNFIITPGGSEANVAVALSNLGCKSVFVSAVSDNVLGEKVLKLLRAEKIRTEFIKVTSGRMGIYWTENGSGPRYSFVIYDRENSVFSNLNIHDFHWEKIISDSSWFHFSGISPALNEQVSRLLEKITAFCSCPYSVDLNFRSGLWEWVERNPLKIADVMKTLCLGAELICGNETDFQNVFGYEGLGANQDEIFTHISKQCFSEFPKLKYIAISHRDSISASMNLWSGYLFVREKEEMCFKSQTYRIDNICDRVGSGDAFVAGILYGLNQSEKKSHEIIDFAVALGALKHTINGDFSSFTVEDVLHVMKTKGSGKIIR